MQVAPSGVRRSKGTDAVEALRRETGVTLGPDQLWCVQTHQTAIRASARKVAGSLLSGWNSPHSAQAGRPAEVLRERRGDALGAGGITSVVARTILLQTAHDAVRDWLRPGRAVAGVAVTSRGERRRGASARRAWLATAGGSGKLLGGGSVQSRLWSGATRSLPICTPGTRRREWTLWMKHGRGLRHLGARRRQRRRPSGRKRGQRHRPGGVASAELASRTTQQVVPRYGSGEWGTTTAGGQRPQ
jgi:hypothetical protein